MNGDLAALSDYCESNSGRFSLDASFYELIGRLLSLPDVAAAKQIVAEMGRRLIHITGPPDDVDEDHGHWYRWLRILSKSARKFIRERYKADESVKREQLWHEYIDRHYVTNVSRSVKQPEGNTSASSHQRANNMGRTVSCRPRLVLRLSEKILVSRPGPQSNI